MSNPVIYTPASYIVPNAVFFGEIGSAAQAVTETSPLPVRDRSTSMGLIERLNREGDPVSGNAGISQFSSFPAPTGAGTPILSGVGSPAVGRATFIQNIQTFSTTPIYGRYQIGQSLWGGTGSAVLHDIGFYCGPNASPVIPVNAFCRSSDRIGVGALVKQWLDPAVSGTHYVSCFAQAWQLADSINFDAKKVILFLGDSLWNGTGPSTVETCIPWLVNKFYRDAGIDSRYILKAYSGSTTTGHEYYRRGGKYDFAQLDAIFYQLGTNDAAQSYSTVTSMANIQALIAWKQARYPGTKLVILGSPPVQNNTFEATLVALRSALSAYVSGLADPDVLFCDQGAAFDRTDANNYAASDGAAGTRIHPDDDGLGLMWNGGYSGYAGLKSWLSANLPAI